MTTEKKKFANHVKNASAPLRYDSRCMGARWGGRGSDFQKSRSREPPYFATPCQDLPALLTRVSEKKDTPPTITTPVHVNQF